MQTTTKFEHQGSTWNESFVTIARDGYELAGVLAEPESSCRAAIVICSSILQQRDILSDGVTELARTLVQVGFATLRFDYAGFGESAGQAWKGSLTTFAADAEAYLNWMRSAYPHVPLICLGISMGAIVAAHAVTGCTGVALIACQPIFEWQHVRQLTKRHGDNSIEMFDYLGYGIGRILYDELLTSQWERDLPTLPTLGVTGLVLYIPQGSTLRAAQHYQQLLQHSGFAVRMQPFEAKRFWDSSDRKLPAADVCQHIQEWLADHG